MLWLANEIIRLFLIDTVRSVYILPNPARPMPVQVCGGCVGALRSMQQCSPVLLECLSAVCFALRTLYLLVSVPGLRIPDSMAPKPIKSQCEGLTNRVGFSKLGANAFNGVGFNAR